MAETGKYSPSDGTRRRPIDIYSGRARYVSTSVKKSDGSPGPGSVDTRTWNVSGTEMTQSEGHPFFSRKRGKAQDLGGPFFNRKYRLSGILQDASVNASGDYGSSIYRYTRQYTGAIAALNPLTASFPPPLSSSDDDLDEYGATAVARCKPTNPVVDLTAALAEIRNSGVPLIPGSQSSWASGTAAARSAGDEYLNAQFGWVPLVNDITAFGDGVVHARDIINRYKQGIGKVQRRSYYFPTETSESIISVSNTTRPWMNNIGDICLTGTTTIPRLRLRKVTQKRWFKGAFTYYFPYGMGGKLGEYAILARQLGLAPTPETVWNVAPWSWALDWFSNTGDVISNWTSFHVDGLVMSYGYIMEHTIVEDTYRPTAPYPIVGGGHLVVPDLVLTTETKIRRPANPYGFGVQWDGLSTFQNSILGALGLSRAFR